MKRRTAIFKYSGAAAIDDWPFSCDIMFARKDRKAIWHPESPLQQQFTSLGPGAAKEDRSVHLFIRINSWKEKDRKKGYGIIFS